MEEIEEKPSLEVETASESESETEKTPKSSSPSKMGRRCASAERLKEETRLVLLDFLGSLPAEKLTARNLTESENRPERLKQALAVAKSNSDAAAYESNRKRFQQMAVPLRRKLSLNLKSEIENFNPRLNLKRRSCESTRSHTSRHKKNAIVYERDSSKFKERPQNLEISPNTNSYETLIVSTPVLSPEGRVAAMLEKIGQEVMENYPDLLDEPLELTRNWNFDDFTYEQFEKAAWKVTAQHSDKTNGIVGWSKIALLCYFAREITLETPIELNDNNLVKLAEYTVRFIEETNGKWMAKQGGWAGLEVEDDETITPESLAVKYREQEDSNELRKLKEARRISGNNRRSRDSGVWNNWAKYGIAAIAVGVGLCYSLIRH